MISREDLADIIHDTLIRAEKPQDAGRGGAQSNNASGGHKTGFFAKERFIVSFSSLKNKKKLITEYELKSLYKIQGRKIRLTGDFIISPLADDFMTEKGIELEIIRDER